MKNIDPTTKKVIIGAIIIVAIIILIRVFRKPKVVDKDAYVVPGSTLKLGSQNDEVEMLQKTYNTEWAIVKGKATIAEDGIFGVKTEAAVLEITGSKQTTLENFTNALYAKL